MRIYASPRRGHCASCEMLISGRPVYYMDETYCCSGCAQGGPCVCTYEADMADDGVDGLGLPFALPEKLVPQVVELDGHGSRRVQQELVAERVSE